jgi:hypothetical protein
LNAIATDFFSAGVVGSISLNVGSGGSGSFAVNAESSPALQVRVSNGVIYTTATPSGSVSQLIRTEMDAFEDVTISSNATGGTRYDWLYLKIDPTNLAAPDNASDNVASLVTSRSTSNSSDNGTPPTYGTLLAIITVANGASSITNSSITDKRLQSGATAVQLNTILGSNPYKFLAYQATGVSLATSPAIVKFSAILYDTSSNYSTSTGLYTAPLNGYYAFDTILRTDTSSAGVAGTPGDSVTAYLYKNGSAYMYGTTSYTTAGWGSNDVTAMISTPLIQLTAGDTIAIWGVNTNSINTLESGANPLQTWFGGYLVSLT